MQDNKGVFIVIEGTDGSGKTVQFKLLERRLREAGRDVVIFDFPQYDEPSSYFIKQYLNGHYGSAHSVNPYLASMFFSLDRYEAAPDIRSALEAGKIVLANRFTGSDMAHQGTKFNHPEERRGYFIWLDNMEYQTFNIPRPDLNIVLRVPAETAQNLVDLEDKHTYSGKKNDLFKTDFEHLKRSVEAYDDLCQLFPKDFARIDCTRSGQLLSIHDINSMLWEKVTPILPLETPSDKIATATVVADTASPVQRTETNNPYIIKTKQASKITKAGYDYLSTVITNTHGNVYAFNNSLSPLAVAAAMARFSRRTSDLRTTILDEFADKLDKGDGLLQRSITAYGDDSLHQLVGQHIVVEKASILLTKKLEWGRLAAYLEQSGHYIYFDQTDEAGSYKFHIPEHFDEGTKRMYIRSLRQIFQLYSSIVHELTEYLQGTSVTPQTERSNSWKSAIRAQACDAAREVLPVATESTVGIFASGQALESLILHLMSDELPEAQKVGQEILNEARKVIPELLEAADKPDRGGATIAYNANTRQTVKKLASEYLPSHYSDQFEPVTLSQVWPRNELDIVADMLYEFSDQSLGNIQKEVDSWTYDKKAAVFQSYMGERLNRRHRPGRALEKIHYSWDLMCDYGIFRDLQRHRMVDSLEWQQLSPRYGYETPQLIEDAGLDEDFERCFELSLELHSHLQKAGYINEAQYATLMGHRIRWKVTFNAREAFHLFELRTSPQDHSSYRKLVLQMHQKLSEVHPILCEYMKFVNQTEDPELTRLAAERYAEYKHQMLQ